MRIVLAINCLRGGGAERVMSWLANRLLESGHEVTLITFQLASNYDYECNHGVRQVHLGFHRYCNSSRVTGFVNLIRWRSLLRRTVEEARADVVLSFIDGMNVYCLFSLLGKRVPIVVAERTDPSQSLMSSNKKKVRPFLYRIKSKAVVFQTENIAAQYKALWRLNVVRVIPNAVQATFTSTPVIQARKVVLAVGRLDRQKGHDVLLNAWAALGAATDGWILRVVGDGIERQNYHQFIEKLDLNGKVELPGFIQDVAVEYQEASVVVLPSRVEGFPNALLEAMAAGKPVVVSNLPDACREVIQHEVNGLLYDGNSPAALADALRRLLGDEQLRENLACKAVEVRQRFSEKSVYSLWEQCLKDACT
jgi:GalNAc-alpha-(1->4)-GalNAc-alpha-(1->3)-diNAcBac-PP-undecaprenol alpha-1,4-N-acetyl-D-galactosaminyltransferase